MFLHHKVTKDNEGMQRTKINSKEMSFHIHVYFFQIALIQSKYMCVTSRSFNSAVKIGASVF